MITSRGTPGLAERSAYVCLASTGKHAMGTWEKGCRSSEPFPRGDHQQVRITRGTAHAPVVPSRGPGTESVCRPYAFNCVVGSLDPSSENKWLRAANASKCETRVSF